MGKEESGQGERAESCRRGARTLADRRGAVAAMVERREFAPQESSHRLAKRSLEAALRDADPAATLDECMISRVSSGLLQAGVHPWPPLLGSEVKPSELKHPEVRVSVARRNSLVFNGRYFLKPEIADWTFPAARPTDFLQCPS